MAGQYLPRSSKLGLRYVVPDVSEVRARAESTGAGGSEPPSQVLCDGSVEVRAENTGLSEFRVFCAESTSPGPPFRRQQRSRYVCVHRLVLSCMVLRRGPDTSVTRTGTARRIRVLMESVDSVVQGRLESLS